MSFSEDIRALRQKCLMSQETFAKEIGVSFATVNRWETGRSQPKYKAMRQIDDYCKKNNLNFDIKQKFKWGKFNE